MAVLLGILGLYFLWKLVGSGPNGDNFSSSKLNTLEELRQEQTCLGEEITGTNVTTLKRNCPDSSLSKDIFCSHENKHEIWTAERPELFVSAKKLRELKPKPRKLVLGSSPG